MVVLNLANLLLFFLRSSNLTNTGEQGKKVHEHDLEPMRVDWNLY